MSIIKITFNLPNNTGLIQKIGVIPGTTEIHFCFLSESEYTYFTNLKFGYVLKHNNEIVKEQQYPIDQYIQYEMADITPLAVDFVNLGVERRYELSVFAENDGKKIESNLEFTTPKPAQPFPSWIWESSTEQWKSPVPPDDDDSIIWNEDLRKWVNPGPRVGA